MTWPPAGYVEAPGGGLLPIGEVEPNGRRAGVSHETPARLAVDRPELAELLEQVEELLRRYVAFTGAGQAVAAALWIAHTHAIEAADVTLYLIVTSAEKRSGKTRLLEVLELLVREPVRASSLTPSVLFRMLDAERRTLLLDEVDAIFSPKSDREELRGVLNAGYRRGAPAYRNEIVGKTITPRAYDAFGAKVLAGVGRLPDTIDDRGTGLRLRRRGPGESVARFRLRDAKEATQPVRAGLEAWATEETIERLRSARPEIPETLHDRAADGWESLLAIADLAGDDWPDRARRAALELHGTEAIDEASLGVVLLRDLRDRFEALGVDRLTTAEIVEALVNDGEGPWAEWWGKLGRDGDHRAAGHRLRRYLSQYEVRPRKIRTADGTRQGYLLEQLRETFDRYLEPLFREEREEERNNGTSQVDGQVRLDDVDPVGPPDTASEQGGSVVPFRDAVSRERGEPEAAATDESSPSGTTPAPVDELVESPSLYDDAYGATLSAPEDGGGEPDEEPALRVVPTEDEPPPLGPEDEPPLSRDEIEERFENAQRILGALGGTS